MRKLYRKPSKATLAVNAETNARFVRDLLALGAVPSGERDVLILETEVGPLNCTPKGDWIYLQFADVARAVATLGRGVTNCYSGKWNLIWGDHVPPKDREIHLLSHLSLVIDVEPALAIVDTPLYSAPSGKLGASHEQPSLF